MNTKSKTISLFFIVFVCILAFAGSMANGKNLFESVYDTFVIFGGNYEYSQGNLAIKISCFLAPLSLFAAFFMFFYHKISEWRFFNIYTPDYVLIFGAGDMGKILATDIKRNHRNLHVVVVEKNEQNPNIDFLESEGVIVVTGDGTQEKLLKKLRLDKASEIVFLAGTDLINLSLYSKLNSMQKEISKRDTPTKCFIHLQQEENVELLNSEDQCINQVNSSSIYDNAARIFFQSHPIFNHQDPLKAIDTNKSHIAIVGFDVMGKALLQMALNLGHFYDPNEKLKISIFSDNGADEIARLNELTFPGSQPYWEVKHYDQKELLKPMVACQFMDIILTKRYTEESISLVSELLRYRLRELVKSGTRFYIYSDIYEDLDRFLNRKQVPITTFGYLGETCSYNVINKQSLDSIAKRVHSDYSKLQHDIKNNIDDKSWDNLTPIEQDSIRYQVEHLRYKVICLNAILKNLKQENINISYDTDLVQEEMAKLKNISHSEILKKLINSNILERLAKVEKNRWNALYLLKGWNILPISGNIVEQQPNLETKEHPDLVTWDELNKSEHNSRTQSDYMDTILYSIDMILTINDMDKTWINKKENIMFKEFLTLLNISF